MWQLRYSYHVIIVKCRVSTCGFNVDDSAFLIATCLLPVVGPPLRAAYDYHLYVYNYMVVVCCGCY